MASSSLWRGSSGGTPGGSAGGVPKNQTPRDRHRSLSLITRRPAHSLEHTRGRYATHDHRFSSGCHAGVGGGPGMWTPAACPPHTALASSLWVISPEGCGGSARCCYVAGCALASRRRRRGFTGVLSLRSPSARAGRCWGLCRRRHLLNLKVHVRIPALEDGTQLPVECLHARLQQQMRTGFGPLHLLFFTEPLAPFMRPHK